MPKATKIEHVHKFQKVIMGGRRVVYRNGKRYLEKCAGYEVFKCMLPDCPTFIATELASGRKSLCWVCGEELTLNAENLKLKKPTHIWCRKTREKLA